MKTLRIAVMALALSAMGAPIALAQASQMPCSKCETACAAEPQERTGESVKEPGPNFEPGYMNK